MQKTCWNSTSNTLVVYFCLFACIVNRIEVDEKIIVHSTMIIYRNKLQWKCSAIYRLSCNDCSVQSCLVFHPYDSSRENTHRSLGDSVNEAMYCTVLCSLLVNRKNPNFWWILWSGFLFCHQFLWIGGLVSPAHLLPCRLCDLNAWFENNSNVIQKIGLTRLVRLITSSNN